MAGAKRVDDDAQRRLEALPPGLREYAEALLPDPAIEEAARRDERERAEVDRVAKHRELADQAAKAFRGDFGKEVQAAVERVLAGVAPLRAPMATLSMCSNIVREGQKRRAQARRPAPAARGAK